MKRSRLLGAVYGFLSTFFFASPVNAALIDNGTHITDTESGLDWLKLTETVHLSYDYVLSQLGPGGEYEGWTYATGTQFEDMLIVQGATMMSCGEGIRFCGWSESNNGIIVPIINLIGDTYENYRDGAQTDQFTGYSLGLLADQADPTKQHAAMLIECPPCNSGTNPYLTHDYASTHYYGGRDRTIADRVVGSYLVRTVPIPPALWLFGSGMLGLIGMARRKNKRKVKYHGKYKQVSCSYRRG